MKRVLFYTANGVGLGHLRRNQLIAEELRKRKIEIVLTTSSLSPQILGRFFDHLVKLEPFTEKLDDDELAYLKARTKNEKRLLAAVKKFKPDLIVGDFHLNRHRFIFYPLKSVLDKYPIKAVFIWRLDSLKKLLTDIKKLGDKLKYFNKVILPHSPMELSCFKPQYGFEVIGPIFKKINRSKLSDCRRKHNISPNDFVLTVTFGAGGKLKGYCGSPAEAVKNFINIYPKLKENITSLKTILIAGPYLRKYPKKRISGLKIIGFEKDLPELIRLSNLVVSSAGYNTGNEIIAAKTPAVLVPLKRSGNEQVKRAEFFEKLGVAETAKSFSSKELFKKILSCRSRLKEMKNNFKNFSDWGYGNKKAAEIILKELNEK